MHPLSIKNSQHLDNSLNLILNYFQFFNYNLKELEKLPSAKLKVAKPDSERQSTKPIFLPEDELDAEGIEADNDDPRALHKETIPQLTQQINEFTQQINNLNPKKLDSIAKIHKLCVQLNRLNERRKNKETERSNDLLQEELTSHILDS